MIKTIIAVAIELELQRPQITAQFGPQMADMLIPTQVDKCRQEWAAHQAAAAAAVGTSLKMGRRRR